MSTNRSVRIVSAIKGNRKAVFGVIILVALVAFELFNYSSTQFSLLDILGNMTFAGIRWATILAFAFCGIDFAGIARIFTPEKGRDEPAEVWYLLAAWFLAAIFNALLTWWGVSVAIIAHTSIGGNVVGPVFMSKVIPIFVASFVLLIRVLLINTFSIAGEGFFTGAPRQANTTPYSPNIGQGHARPISRVTSQPNVINTQRAPFFGEPGYRPTQSNNSQNRGK